MHVVDIFIFISIGQVLGWLVTIYAETDHRRLPGHLAAATVGAFIGGYLSLSLISELSKYSMIFSAFVSAGVLLYLVRYKGRLQAMYAEVKRRSAREVFHEEVSFGKQGTSIIITILLIAAIFLFLAWTKSLQIKSLRINGAGMDDKMTSVFQNQMKQTACLVV